VYEAVHSVSVLDDAFPFNVVENFAHLLRGKLMMIQEQNEVGNRALEVNVIFPESIVGIDEKSLGRQGSSSWLSALGLMAFN
jgi:hypothetical protein